MKIARLVGNRWTPESLPRRFTQFIDGKHTNMPLGCCPDVSLQNLIYAGYIDESDVGVTVAAVSEPLPVCNVFQQIDAGVLAGDTVTFGVEQLPEPQFTQTLEREEETLLRAAEAWQEGHPQGIRGTGMHLLDRLLAYTEQQAPKAYAVEAWIRGLWAEHATRLAVLRTGDPVGADFSDYGTKPFTVEELQAEEAGLVGA